MLLTAATKLFSSSAAAGSSSPAAPALLLHAARRGIVGGADHNKSEPTASPWVKVLERPGDEQGNRSEEVYVENPNKNKDSKDVSADVPEKVCGAEGEGGRQHKAWLL